MYDYEHDIRSGPTIIFSIGLPLLQQTQETSLYLLTTPHRTLQRHYLSFLVILMRLFFYLGTSFCQCLFFFLLPMLHETTLFLIFDVDFTS